MSIPTIIALHGMVGAPTGKTSDHRESGSSIEYLNRLIPFWMPLLATKPSVYAHTWDVELIDNLRHGFGGVVVGEPLQVYDIPEYVPEEYRRRVQSHLSRWDSAKRVIDSIPVSVPNETPVLLSRYDIAWRRHPLREVPQGDDLIVSGWRRHGNKIMDLWMLSSIGTMRRIIAEFPKALWVAKAPKIMSSHRALAYVAKKLGLRVRTVQWHHDERPLECDAPLLKYLLDMERSGAVKIKPWGMEEIFYHGLYTLKKITVYDGHRTSRQSHERKTETIYVLDGDLVLEVEGKFSTLRPAETVTIHPGQIHRMIGPSVYLEASTPELSDVIRHQDDYGR